MKRGRSTGKPNKAEAARIASCKSGPCIPCLVWSNSPESPVNFLMSIGGDYHHLLSGGRRIGHHAGICACAWHHRAVPDYGCTGKDMREWYGPSLLDGSKVFSAVYGTDAELLQLQNQLLGESAE